MPRHFIALYGQDRINENGEHLQKAYESQGSGLHYFKKIKKIKSMNIRLTQIDGKLPNLALMKLAHYFTAEGHKVFFQRSIMREVFEPEYDQVFGSAIFSASSKKVELFKKQFPNAIVGGTWCADYDLTVESYIGVGKDDYEFYDYSIYGDVPYSIGFSQRGCRLKCPFCVVPKKEGKNRSINSFDHIRRFNPSKNILLLDNDFFGQPQWEKRCKEAIDNDYKICFSQGINIRLINHEKKSMQEAVTNEISKPSAEYLAEMRYYDTKFKNRRIYTAWDNRKDEKRFMKGINTLLDAGIKPNHIMVYFLCNYWEEGLTEDVWYRFNQMCEIGLKPYPMIFDKENACQDLKDFQRWVIRRNYLYVPFAEYNRSGKAKKEIVQPILF